MRSDVERADAVGPYLKKPATRTFALRSRGAEASVGFSAVGSGYYKSLGKKGDARLAPSQVGVFRRECAMGIVKPFTSNTRLITLCSRCHHSEFIHSDSTGGPCLFSECNCPRYAPKPSRRTPKRQMVS
jgi:hypothetical protein